MSSQAVTPQFDVDGARKAGYSDDEILQHLTTSRNFDIAGATKAGYSKQDIINHLSTTPPPASPQKSSGDYLGNILSNATISPPEPGLTGALDRLRGKVRGMLQGGGRPDAAVEAVGGAAIGPITALHGAAQMPSHPVRGINEMVQGAGQAAALPMAVAIPATMALSAPSIVAQQGVQKGLQAVGVNKDYAELAGNIAGIATGAGINKGMKPAAPITATDAAAKITDAVNPPPKNAANFQKNVAANLDVVRDTAQRAGIDIKSRPGLAKAFETAGNETRATYYDKMLGPVKDVEVPTTSTRAYGATYEGANSSPNHATLGALDARLSDINAIMRGGYEKGGNAAQAAVKSKGDLAAEAAWIRSTLYNEIGTRTGIDPGTVASTRAQFGQMSDIADKINQSVAKSRFAENAAKQGERLPHTATELALRVANTAKNKVLGHPADRAIAKTVGGMDQPAAQAPLNPTGPPQPRFVRPADTGQAPAPAKADPNIQGTSPQEINAMQKQFAQRSTQVQQGRMTTLGEAGPAINQLTGDAVPNLTEHPIMQNGKRVGRVTIKPDTGEIGYIGPDIPKGTENPSQWVADHPLEIGQSGVKNLIRQLKAEHPGLQAEDLFGKKTSNRTKPGSIQRINIKGL